jgi:dsRNA-specific ribonuclease
MSLKEFLVKNYPELDNEKIFDLMAYMVNKYDLDEITYNYELYDLVDESREYLGI